MPAVFTPSLIIQANNGSVDSGKEENVDDAWQILRALVIFIKQPGEHYQPIG